MPRRVAITGITGYLGSHLAWALERDPGVEFILGIDSNPPTRGFIQRFSKLEFVRNDVGQPFGGCFLERWIDTAIHLAFCPVPTGDPQRDRGTNQRGTRRFLEACHRAGIERVLLASCASVYGVARVRSEVVDETSPLRAETCGREYVEDKVAQEAQCRSFADAHPEVQLLIARPATILGPGASHWRARALRSRPMLVPHGRPPVQFCHVDDVTRALVGLLDRGVSGVFNIGPDDAVPLRKIGRAFAPCSVVVPDFVIDLARHKGWGRLWPYGSEPGQDVSARWRWPKRVISRKLQTELGFNFEFSSEQTFDAFVGGLRNRRETAGSLSFHQSDS